jgi:NAD-dependent SIR2 family protein deacetylase
MPAFPSHESIERAAALIAQADSLIVAAGAGIGVDSGLPDFRGTDGFWKAYPALARSGIDFYRIASPASFTTAPARAWGFYGHRLALYRRTIPHAGFELLKKWGQAKPHGYFVYTSNVDGQFQKAGFDPLRIHECHGSIHHLQCIRPCSESLWPADSVDPVVDEARCELKSPLPICPHCGSIARPNILMFDDWDWIEARAQSQTARLEQWLAQACNPVVIEIGAGTAIATVRHFSRRVVQQHGRLVRINPREPEVAGTLDAGLAMGALDALHAIDAALHARTAPS